MSFFSYSCAKRPHLLSFILRLVMLKSENLLTVIFNSKNKKGRVTMKILKTKDYEQMSRVTANILSAQVIMKPRCVLGLATGSTPIGAYRQLIDWYEKGDIDFSEVTSINLDEYKGLSPENDQSYRYFMNTNLFNHINIKKENTYVPDGLETDADRACSRYNQITADLGGIDLQLLGLGNNGHIGFNEPGAAFEKETHCVDLTQSTINANARFFSSLSEVPKQAYTMGIKTIMQAKKIVVAVSGAGKATGPFFLWREIL